jgi:hypothetical protein
VNRTPVLWIVGSIGTGKSDTSYHVFSRLFRAGTRIARLDLDDVGMCHPAPEDDPENHRVKATAMAATWAVFARAGAGCFVVSGSASSRPQVDLYTSRLPDADWTIVRLRLDDRVRRDRTVRRGRLLGQNARTVERWIETGIEEEAALEAGRLADQVIDIGGLDQQEVVDAVLTRTGWPDGGRSWA